MASAGDLSGRVLPVPRSIELLEDSIELPRPHALPEPTIESVTRAARGGAEGPVCVALAPRGGDAERRLAAAGAPVPDHPEGYAIAPREDRKGILLAAREALGLLRGAATLAQLRTEGPRDRLTLPLLRASDFPSTGVRILGGWALWRAHDLREAVALASAFKANRVLYNGWGWTPGDRLTREDALLVEHARERGIELVFELRRMSFGREFRITHPENRRRVVETYLEAADSGFRSFGLLFDDVPWETAEDECSLACDLLGALDARGPWPAGAPEIFVCPQFYWYPGQMDAAWKGRAAPEEEARQRAYLGTYGRSLPPRVHVYIANYWGDHPLRYEEALRCGFAELIGRRPVFFDNQVINDYRHGALLPFALHSRPRSFGDHYAGYCLNAACPLAAYAASAATALAYAWNPAAYRAEEAMGAALRWLHGPSEARIAHAAEGTNRLRALAIEWAGGAYTAVSHYATIWRLVREGQAQEARLARWKEEIRAIRAEWLAALGETALGARPMGIEGLLHLVRDSHRLERDLDLFAAYLELSRAPGAGPGRVAGLEARLQEVEAGVIACLKAILPPAPGLAPLLSDPGSLEPRVAPAWSWAEYFGSSARRALGSLASEMLAELKRPR